MGLVAIGVDNGITGSVGVITPEEYQLFNMPTKVCLNYQKTKVKHITRVDTKLLKDGLKLLINGETNVKCLIERPMVNPQRFEATTSALRALESVLIVLEDLGIGYDYCDSKAWQKELLPFISVQDKKDYPAKLKQVSKEVAMRKFPNLSWDYFKDGDGILIAEFCRLYYS